MDYFDQNNYKTKIRSGIVVLVVLLFLAVLEFVWPQSFGWVRQGAVFITKPVTQKLWQSQGDDYNDIDKLIEEHKDLKAILEATVYDYIDLQDTKLENAELKEFLDFSRSNNFNQVTSEIIGEKIIGNINFIIIDKGSRDGIKIGQPVIVGKGVLVGLVSHIDSHISYIVPIEENTTALSARIVGKQGSVHGVIEGTPGVATHLRLIPKGIDLQPGDTIVTSGFDELIPANLFIGSAERIENETNSFFQSTVVNFLVDYHEYNFVHVIKFSDVNITEINEN